MSTEPAEVEKAEKRVTEDLERVRLGLAALSVVVDAQTESESYNGRAIASVATAATAAIFDLQQARHFLALAKKITAAVS